MIGGISSDRAANGADCIENYLVKAIKQREQADVARLQVNVSLREHYSIYFLMTPNKQHSTMIYPSIFLSISIWGHSPA
jgi:hypothetical protein